MYLAGDQLKLRPLDEAQADHDLGERALHLGPVGRSVNILWLCVGYVMQCGFCYFLLLAVVLGFCCTCDFIGAHAL